MDIDLRSVLRWLIYGLIGFLALSLVGVLVDVASTLLWLLLKIGVVILVGLFILQLLDNLFD